MYYYDFRMSVTILFPGLIHLLCWQGFMAMLANGHGVCWTNMPRISTTISDGRGRYPILGFICGESTMRVSLIPRRVLFIAVEMR